MNNLSKDIPGLVPTTSTVQNIFGGLKDLSGNVVRRKLSLSPPTTLTSEESISKSIFSADDYNFRMRMHRITYVDKHFKNEFLKFFRTLEKRANDNLVLQEALVIDVNEDLDINVVEEKLSLFIKDCGYAVVVEPRKEGRRLTFNVYSK